MRIGIYGGTFDPIHCGHLILAREALEKIGLSKVIFVPAAASPFKGVPAANGEIRLLMLRSAIDEEEGFSIDDCELLRPPPSYAVDTVEEIRKRESDADLHYLLGEDNVSDLPKWHRFNDLEAMVTFVVLNRTGIRSKHDYTVVERKIDISATDIRNRVASGRSIRYLVPADVEEIIRRQNIYREKER